MMTIALIVAAFLAFAVGLAHSVLGERYILMRLLSGDTVPHLFGGPDFTARTLRFAWHLTTIAWWGFAAILVLLACGKVSPRSLCTVVSATFLLTGALTFFVSRGHHHAWIVFFTIGAICFYVACIANP